MGIHPPAKGAHQNVARAARVISALAAERTSGLRLTDVANATGLGTATVHRLLAGLLRHGFVDQHGGRYFVGLHLLGWAAAASGRYGLAPFADASLDRLRVETGDTIYFSLISGHDAVCVDCREGAYPIRTLTLAVGDRRPLGVGAASLALLAFQTEAARAAILAEDGARRAAFGIAEDALAEAVARARAQGYAVFDAWQTPGMVGVGVPVRRQGGAAVAALSAVSVAQRLSGERLESVAAALLREAAEIERLAAEVLETPMAHRQPHR